MKSILCIAVTVAIVSWTSLANAQRLVPPGDVSSITELAQTADTFRVNELEEQIRQLNGKVEELNFLLLQLQEKIRMMEEETEIRLQEIEEKQSGLGDSNSAKDTTSVADLDNREPDRLGKPDTSGATLPSDVEPADNPVLTELPVRADEPRALGTLTFDKDGNVVDSGAANLQLSGLPGIFNDGSEGSVEAAEFGATPLEVLASGVGELQVRRYKRAQQAFSAFLKAWPNDPDTGKAKFYLGEAYFWQKEYYRAADSHLDAHNNYPEAETAPENLLALGLALAGLNQREVACATYAEVLKQYPEAEPRLGARVRDEQAATKC
ncbi:MAG: tol-pal system protein YbgF [Rhizobiaceae bacterium]